MLSGSETSRLTCRSIAPICYFLFSICYYLKISARDSFQTRHPGASAFRAGSIHQLASVHPCCDNPREASLECVVQKPGQSNKRSTKTKRLNADEDRTADADGDVSRQLYEFCLEESRKENGRGTTAG
jgi:hypothetical protein